MDTAALEQMLARGQDNALLRFTLGNAMYQSGRWAEAEAHLAKALEFDPAYSAAWTLYGRALEAAGKTAAAIGAFERGIAAATEKGDMQALKAMRVFLKRLKKT